MMNPLNSFLPIAGVALILFALGCNAPPPQQLPDIESTVISLKKKKIEDFNYKNLEQIVRVSFSQRRKKIKNTLKAIVNYNELEKFSEKRPEMLSVDDFIQISNTIKDMRAKANQKRKNNFNKLSDELKFTQK